MASGRTIHQLGRTMSDVRPVISRPVKQQRIKYVTPDQLKMKLKSPLGLIRVENFISTHNNTNIVHENMYADLIDLFTQFSQRPFTASKRTTNKRKSGFPREYKKQKNTLNRVEKMFRKNPFDRNLKQNLLNARKDLKRMMKKEEERLRNNLTEKLLEAKKNNPEEFWKLISRMKKWGKPENDSSSSISPREWHTYFTDLFRVKKDLPEQIQQQLKALEDQAIFTNLSFRINERGDTIGNEETKPKS